jgi:hypothetical protein
MGKTDVAFELSSSAPPPSPPMPDDRQLYQFVFGQLSLGKKDAEIVNLLVAKGVQADKAQTIVQTARDRRKTAIRRRGKRRIKIGLIAFSIGVLITVGTFLAAASSVTGGVYVVSFGPILLGLYYLALGMADSMKR